MATSSFGSYREFVVAFTCNIPLSRFDLNQSITSFENPAEESSFSKKWWSLVSNAFNRSVKVIPVKTFGYLVSL